MKRLKFYWPLMVTVAMAIAFTWFLLGLREKPPRIELAPKVSPRAKTAHNTAPWAGSTPDTSPPTTVVPEAPPAVISAPSATPHVEVPVASRPTTTPPAQMKPKPADETAPRRAMDTAAKEELGRLMLPYVGASDEANEVWLTLINDPEISAKVREDLIEDLNETGFSDGDGRRPTVEDLPLIRARILLIEEHAADAMDEVNAAAFAEAYKDLMIMWERLSQQQ